MQLLVLVCAALLSVAAASPTTPVRNAADYRLRRHIPSGCDPDSCDYFMGVDTNSGNSSYLDFYLTGEIDGWVAVGFSLTQSMFDADVVGCNSDSVNAVFVVDTYNPSGSRTNIRDTGGDTDIVTHMTMKAGGRITCLFSRRIVGDDPSPQDFNLDGDYYLLYGLGDSGNSGAGAASFPSHRPIRNPVLSSAVVNPVQAMGELPIVVDPVDNPDGVTLNVREPTDYRLRRHIPSGCDPDSCDYFMGVDTNSGNSSYLDFYLTGEIDGWVAVGFSLTPSMFDADVVGCNSDNVNAVFVVDTYNPSSRTNIRDTDDNDNNDIVTHMTMKAGGRITCLFSRRIVGDNPSPQDFNLDGDYYLLYGLGDSGNSGAGAASFPSHRPNRNPVLSSAVVNPVQATGELPIVVDPVDNPDGVTSPLNVREPTDYRLRRHIPSGCDPDSCEYFMGVDTNSGNSSYLDFYLTGEIDGWVAVGFSLTQSMFDADVVGCNSDNVNAVFVVDTYNPSGRTNIRDTGGDTDIVTHMTMKAGGRITCLFSRRIVGDDPSPQDFNLNGDYYLLYGLGDNGNSGAGAASFRTHRPDRNPVLSSAVVNPVQAMGELPIVVDPVDNPDGVTLNAREPTDYRLRRHIPSGCDPDSCEYFMGVDTNSGNSSYLDFYLTGEIDGWVAVGFSLTQSMFDADVVGCNSNVDGVFAVDTYNPSGRTNIRDTGGDTDIVTHMTMKAGGRITCLFSRRIVGDDPSPQDFNLDGDYYLMYGLGDSGGGVANFPSHRPNRNPVLSSALVNPVQDMGELPTVVDPVDNPDGVTLNVREPADYRLRRRDPSGCDPDSCDYFMGVDTNSGNSSYLDFYLTADINGWVAVGFSRTSNMFDADVVGCNSNVDGVFAVDTYNPSGRTNTRDTNSDGNDTVTHMTMQEGGRITCLFSRRLVGDDPEPQDFNLDDDYFFLFGVGGGGGGSANFPEHVPLIPQISDGEFNPLRDSGEIGISLFRQQLIQAHGILMLVAWPILAFTAIFFAAWMKPALPNGEWFQVHRAFHIAALFVAVVAFILIFVAHKDNDTAGLIGLGSENPTGTAHFVLGIIIMALQIVNPIIAIFRCKPNGDYRWIFNLIHGLVIGLGVEMLAFTNIGIGISIFSERDSIFHDLTIFWVYLAFVVFFVILISGLLVIFTGTAIRKGAEGTNLAPAPVKPLLTAVYSGRQSEPTSVEMTAAGGDKPSKPDGPPPRKPASADAPLRWIALGIFLGVMLPIMVALIVMIAATLDD